MLQGHIQRRVYTYSCDAVSTGSGKFVGNAILSVICRDDGSFPSASTCSEPTLSFVVQYVSTIGLITALELVAGAIVIDLYRRSVWLHLMLTFAH